MKKTAVILTIVSVFLWVVFIAIRLLKPDYSFLICRMEVWLFTLCTLLTSVAVAFWLSAFTFRCHRADKTIIWIVYGLVSILWLYMFLFACLPFGYLAYHYQCSNDKHYVMYSDFDGTMYGVTLYQKRGVMETLFCDLDWYPPPFNDPKVFVYDAVDAIVVQYDENDSLYTDVYHFNGDIYTGSAKDSVLLVVKLLEEK